MIKGKKIFITGGAGFIANKIIARLIENNEIIVYDNFTRDTLSKSPYISHKNLTVIKGDILDYDLLESSLPMQTDIVIHTAAIAGIDTVIKQPSKTMKVNILGTANVLEAAVRKKVKERVTIFSTSEVFGGMAYKVSEDALTISGSAGEARWSYAVSKLADEHLSMAYMKDYGLPIVIVRPFNVYGPGQTGEGAMSIFIKKALKNENLEIYGDGTRIRAWCYIDDFAEALFRALSFKKAIGESFNIGNPRAVITVYGLAQTICRVLESKSKIIFKPDLSADIDLRIPSIEKMETILGYFPKTDLEEGILKTAEWIKNVQQKN